MKGIWSIAVIASILILGIISIQQVYAPDNDKPEKIVITGNGWNAETQSFVVTIEMIHGLFEAIKNAGFILEIEFKIVDENSDDYERYLTLDISGDNDESEPRRRITRSTTLYLPYDPVTNGIEGFAEVIVNAKILNPAGKPVAVAESLTVTLDIRPPPPTTCETDNDCPEGSSCVFGICVADNTPVPEFCEDDSDCPRGLSCQLGVCLPF